jgi:gamma-glutamyltranspeptidase/glutathione hydrolase
LNYLGLCLMFLLVFWGELTGATLCKSIAYGQKSETQPGRGVVDSPYRKGIVVAAHPLAAQAGLSILKAGGNAFDAGIAVEMALAVVLPAAGNLGGGGFLLIHTPGDGTEFLDYREQAPIHLNKSRYIDSVGAAVGKNTIEGATAAGIPGTLAGMEALHQKHGRLPWHKILEPAVELAAKGWALTRREAELLNKHSSDLIRINGGHTYLSRETRFSLGDTLRNPELAMTLSRLAERGAREFYQGEIARRLAEFLSSEGSDLILADLQQYRAVWRAPVCGSYGPYRLCSAGPPSSGGFLLLQMLGLMQASGRSPGALRTNSEIHLMMEAARRAYADRSEYLGDPDQHSIPLASLLDSTYLRMRSDGMNRRKATRSVDVYAGALPSDKSGSTPLPSGTRFPTREPTETTHYVVADDEGNVLTATTSLNGAYGSHRVVPGLGFLLNNTIDDFSLGKGLSNSYGLSGSDANALGGGKRMLSSMTPTLVYSNGRPEMALGSPGGSTIPTTVLQVFLYHTYGGMDAARAVARPRLHHQWKPDYIRTESRRLSVLRKTGLRLRGHKIRTKPPIGRAALVHLHPDGRMEGGADPRGDDCVMGY